MSYADKPPYICEPVDQSQGRLATFIFLHGYGDDAEGLPLGIAQKFQTYNRLPYLRWLLPNAPYNHEAHDRAWYLPKALSSPSKPRIPGHEFDDDDDGSSNSNNKDDEAGIMKTVDTIDKLVQAEIDRGVPADRIIVGGFSQGCATSLVWGLTSVLRNRVAGIVCASGYFPLAKRIRELQLQRGLHTACMDKQEHHLQAEKQLQEQQDDREKQERQEQEQQEEEEEKTKQQQKQKQRREKQWLLLHGSRDVLVSQHLFRHLSEQLHKHVDNDTIATTKESIEGHVYDGMGHSFCNEELRDILRWVERVVPP